MDKKEVKNVIDFYKVANMLKYRKESISQSEASKVYGAIILAIAIDSEYNKKLDLEKIISIILLEEMKKREKDEFNKVISKLKKGKAYKKIITEDSKEKELANEFLNIEKLLNYFFDIYIPKNNINENDFDEIYKEAIKRNVIGAIGKNEVANYQILKFYYLNRVLKKKERSGWNDNNWNILIEEREKVSEHVIGTLALALALSSENDFKINIEKVLKTLSLHEIGEIIIGDITPFDGVSKEEKEKREHEAIKEILGTLKMKNEISKLLFDFDKRKKKTAKFAYLCDKLDADLQSKIYQDLGLQHPLSEQENNKTFNYERTRKMVEEGAETAFDIWYLYDKDIYKDNKPFSKVLKYAKNNNLK